MLMKCMLTQTGKKNKTCTNVCVDLPKVWHKIRRCGYKNTHLSLQRLEPDFLSRMR